MEITTNGGAFRNEKVVDCTVAAKPFNINVSIDFTTLKSMIIRAASMVR